ncbi:MAG TPA: MFS transporter, partial [Roseovarius sp.]|nr:MFS transporter [Roseovarius sp.]
MNADAALLDSRYAWTRLAVSLAIAMIGNVGMWSIIVVMPAMQAEFGVDRAAASMPYTLTMIGFALGNLGIGRVVDRFGVTTALIGSALLISAATALAALSPTVILLSSLQFLIGFGTAASFGPLIADVSLWFLKRRGIAVAITASGNYLSGAIWPVILAGILSEQGWRAVYMVLAVVTVAGVIPLALLLRRRVPMAARAHADSLSSARAGATGLSPRALALLLGLAGVGCCVAMSMPQVHIVSYCVDLGYGPAVGSQMLSLMLLGGVASRIVSGLLADRLGGVRTLLIGSALQCLALFLYLPSGGLTSLYIVSLV